MANTQDLEETDAKAQKLLLEAEAYDDNAKEMKNNMTLRNRKVQIVLAILGAAIIVSILLAVLR
jgi:hypothetical protein